MVGLNVQADKETLKDLIKYRTILKLKEGQRRTLMRSWGRKVGKFARENVKAQRNVNGTSWKGRKARKGKKKQGKLLKNIALAKYLTPKVVTSDSVEVGYLKSKTGRIAREHQDGIAQLYKMSGNKNYGGGKYDQPATDRQAKALIVSGYKIRRARKLNWNKEKQYSQYRKGGASNWVVPSKAWIKRNIKAGQAGLILHEMGYASVKRSWLIERPSRSFLGASKEQITDMLDEVYEAMLERKRNK